MAQDEPVAGRGERAWRISLAKDAKPSVEDFGGSGHCRQWRAQPDKPEKSTGSRRTDTAKPTDAEPQRPATAEAAAGLAEQDVLPPRRIWSPRVPRSRPTTRRSPIRRLQTQRNWREASRAERVANVQRTRRDVMRLEGELAVAEAGTDDAAKKKRRTLEKELGEARKRHEAAQAALGQSDESYTRFGKVYPTESTGRRAALARWIASQNNPLTARVAINQIWMRHFGSPLVASVFRLRPERQAAHPPRAARLAGVGADGKRLADEADSSSDRHQHGLSHGVDSGSRRKPAARPRECLSLATEPATHGSRDRA